MIAARWRLEGERRMGLAPWQISFPKTYIRVARYRFKGRERDTAWLCRHMLEVFVWLPVEYLRLTGHELTAKRLSELVTSTRESMVRYRDGIGLMPVKKAQWDVAVCLLGQPQRPIGLEECAALLKMVHGDGLMYETDGTERVKQGVIQLVSSPKVNDTWTQVGFTEGNPDKRLDAYQAQTDKASKWQTELVTLEVRYRFHFYGVGGKVDADFRAYLATKLPPADCDGDHFRVHPDVAAILLRAYCAENGHVIVSEEKFETPKVARSRMAMAK